MEFNPKSEVLCPKFNPKSKVLLFDLIQKVRFVYCNILNYIMLHAPIPDIYTIDYIYT